MGILRKIFGGGKRKAKRVRSRRDPGAKRRYHFSIWGRSPGFGYETGWAFGSSPAAAVKDALADAAKYRRHAWKLPANVYLRDDDGASLAFYVTADGTITEGQGPHSGRDARRRRRRR